MPKLASHSRVAFPSIALNTASSSPGELEMTRRTSANAFSRSIASFSSLVRASSFSFRSATEGLLWRAAVGALLRSGFVVLACCVFAGLRLIVRRRLTEPLSLGDDHTLPHHEVRCAPQQNSLSIGSYGSNSALRPCRLDVRFAQKPTRLRDFITTR